MKSKLRLLFQLIVVGLIVRVIIVGWDIEAFCPLGGILSFGTQLYQDTMACSMSEVAIFMALAMRDADGVVTATGEGSVWVVASLGAPSDSILVTVQRRGAITVTFDDGFVSVYENAWPLFREFGLPANVAVNPIPVDLGWSGYLTHEMLDELSDAGWSIVSHTLEHDSLPSLSACVRASCF